MWLRVCHDEATMPKVATVGIRTLKNQLSRFVDRVRRGQEITVTDRGAAVARLVPADARRVLDDLVAEGIVKLAPRRRRPARARIRLRGRGPSMAEYVTDQRR